VYKVFFVDDEAAMRAGFRDSMNWNNSNFVLAGEASDGELALPLISETLPDILVTDVRMPFMDGIELSRRVARTMPWVKIIILSGHDEFDYAKQAIKIGVSEYLLKPVTSEALFQALENAAARIELERERRRTIEDLKKAATDARRLQTEKLLSCIVYGTTTDFPFEESELGAFVYALSFQTMLIEIVFRESGESGDVESAWIDETSELARARSSILKILESNDSVRSFPEGAERIVCVCASDDETLEDEIYAIAQAVKYDTERSGPYRVSVALGALARNVSELPKSMSCAKKAMKYIEGTGHGYILGYRDIENRDVHGEHGAQTGGSMASRYQEIIEKSREYIWAHYADGAVSLNSVAEFIGLSPNHFSTVFSQETGETFIEHLTRTRLLKAQELLRSTPTRASEIAYMVGYNDPHYFSYVFKKRTGMSPSEYRKSAANN
jgi:two-component system response regulator YesN